MTLPPTMDRLAQYLLGLYENDSGESPEAIIADLWEKERTALRLILECWAPKSLHLQERSHLSGPFRFAAQFYTALRDDPEYAGDLFAAFAGNDDLEDMLTAMFVAARWKIKEGQR